MSSTPLQGAVHTTSLHMVQQQVSSSYDTVEMIATLLLIVWGQAPVLEGSSHQASMTAPLSV